jgi:hypothetical protein
LTYENLNLEPDSIKNGLKYPIIQLADEDASVISDQDHNEDDQVVNNSNGHLFKTL